MVVAAVVVEVAVAAVVALVGAALVVLAVAVIVALVAAVVVVLDMTALWERPAEQAVHHQWCVLDHRAKPGQRVSPKRETMVQDEH